MVPAPEAQLRCGCIGQVEPTREPRIGFVTPIRPPQVLSAVGLGRQQLCLGRAGECELHRPATLDLDVVDAILTDIASRHHRKVRGLCVPGIHAGVVYIDLVIAVLALVQRRIVDEVGDGPVCKDVLVGEVQVHILQHLVHAGQAVLLVGYQRLGRALTKAVKEVAHKQVGGTVVGRSGSGLPYLGPSIELGVRRVDPEVGNIGRYLDVNRSFFPPTGD